MSKTPKTSEHAAAQDLLKKYGVTPGQAPVASGPLLEEEIVPEVIVAAGTEIPALAQVLPEPELPLPPVPPAPVDAERTPEEVRLHNRQEAAKEEQRKLSSLQRELHDTLARLGDKERLFDERLKAPATPAALPAAPIVDPALEAFIKENPALSEVMRKLAVSSMGDRASDNRLAEELTTRLSSIERTVQASAYDSRKAQVIDFIEDPNEGVPGASQLADTEAFQDYLASLPRPIRDQAHQGIYKNTGDADPEFLRWVFKSYHAQATPALAPPPGQVPGKIVPRPPQAPTMRPANAGPAKPAGDGLTPLTPDEARNFSGLMIAAGEDGEARKLLFKRMAISLQP